MIILGIDVETTGISDDSEIVELGMVVYNTNLDDILSSHGMLFEVSNWSEEAEKIHGISKELVDSGGIRLNADFDPWNIVKYSNPELILAHNAAFDYKFITRRWPTFNLKPWLCTQYDLKHPSGIGNSKRLSHLTIDYGFPVMKYHRATYDAEMVCRIAAKHNLKEALKLKNQPKFKVSAFGPYDDNCRHILKKAGFAWKQKEWIKRNLDIKDVKIYEKLVKYLNKDWKFTSEKEESRSY